jgi:hypothetical protein
MRGVKAGDLDLSAKNHSNAILGALRKRRETALAAHAAV